MTQKYFKKIGTLIALVAFLAIFSSTICAQVIVPAANTNNGSVNDPLGTWYGFERSAMIYTSAQIGTTGNITDVGFYVNSVSTPGNATNVRIYMKMRTTTFTANSTYANETTGATLVYGPTTITGASFAVGWNTVTLTTPFNYTGGLNNLEIIVETNATGSGNEGSTGKQFRYETQGNNQYFQYWNGDTTAPTGNGTRSTSRPNVSLTFPLVACSGTPTGGSVTVSPTSGIPGSTYGVTATGYTTGTGLTYQWQYSDTGGAPWTNQGTATSSYTSLTGMVAPAAGTVRTWRLVTTCTASSSSANSTIGTFTSVMLVPASGNNTYTTCSGLLYDNGCSAGNYTNNSNGYSVITPSTAGNYAQVTGTGATESNYDYLYIYDGIGTGGTLLYSGSGTLTIPLITSITGSLTVRFTSDVSNVNTGFALNVSCTTTAGSPVYCTPTTWDPDGLYINSLAFVGTLADPPVNTSTFSATGYQNFTTLSPLASQAQGEGVNIVAYATGTTMLRGTWKAWVDWNNDGDFTDTGEEVFNIYGFAGGSVTFGFAIPAAQTPGNYRMRIRVNNGTNWLGNETYGFDFTSCSNFTTTGGWFPDSDYGETEDYLFTVVAKCNSLITAVGNGETCGTGTVNLGATASSGVTEFRWYNALTGGTLVGTSVPTGLTTTWTTPSISSTTTYYVTAWNGSCESQVRTAVEAKISPTPTVSFTPSNPIVCGENQAIQITAGGDKEIVHLVNENFEAGGLGVFSNINTDANVAAVDNKTKFANQTSVYVPTTLVNVWYPAISSGFGPNKCVVADSDASSPDYPTSPVENSLALTSSVNTNGFLNLTLKLKFYYSRYYPSGLYPDDEYSAIELSTDNGATYPIQLAKFTANQGIGSRFIDLSYNISAYINTTNLKIRIRQYSFADASTGWTPGGVAVDNVELFGEKALNTAFNYDTTVIDAYTDAACTIPYTSGTPATTIWVKPTLAQLENAMFTIPVTTVLSNGCTATGSINVTNNSKIYAAGTGPVDWNTAANWKPNGVPTASNCIIIVDDDVNLDTGANGLGLNLTVKPTGNLNIASGQALTITDFVKVEAGGTFAIENSASLIQINNVANTGIINMKRNAVTNNTLDYVYWSTPVAAFSVNNITPASVFRYLWNPTTVTGYASNFGNWAGASGAMTTGRGYIIRGSSGTSTFIGTPNNGNITTPITRSTYTGATYTGPTSTQVTSDDDNWNLLGNPYPSAISADDFLAANSANLNQFVKIWTHGIDPSAAIADPFYQDYLLNYSTADYITYNALGGTQFGYDGKIGAGQGFFVLMNDANSTSENAIFNNTMRSNAHRNDQFYRTENEVEKHRIWLTIGSPTNASISTLVGYTTEASNNLDNKYDAIAQGVKTNFELYSIAESQELIIQGRSLPFNQNDEVILGVAIPQNGIYTIAISNVDGLFSDTAQNIYLEDKQLGIFHDLRTAPYTFTGTVGRDENRFVLLYNSSRLSQDDVTLENNLTVVTNDNVTLYSSNENINSIEVYDLLGKVVQKYNNINSKEFMLSHLTKNNTTLLLKVKLNNGVIVNKKVIF